MLNVNLCTLSNVMCMGKEMVRKEEAALLL